MKTLLVLSSYSPLALIRMLKAFLIDWPAMKFSFRALPVQVWVPFFPCIPSSGLKSLVEGLLLIAEEIDSALTEGRCSGPDRRGM